MKMFLKLLDRVGVILSLLVWPVVAFRWLLFCGNKQGFGKQVELFADSSVSGVVFLSLTVVCTFLLYKAPVNMFAYVLAFIGYSGYLFNGYQCFKLVVETQDIKARLKSS